MITSKDRDRADLRALDRTSRNDSSPEPNPTCASVARGEVFLDLPRTIRPSLHPGPSRSSGRLRPLADAEVPGRLHCSPPIGAMTRTFQAM
jgi:hypothetical protein